VVAVNAMDIARAPLSRNHHARARKRYHYSIVKTQTVARFFRIA
jgi:hypothetical protein